MHLRKVLFIPVFLISLNISAQIRFGVEASGNLSLISNYEATDIIEVTSDRTDSRMFRKETYGADYNNKTGGGIMAGLQYFFNKENISLDAGLDINNINFNQVLTKTASYMYLSNTDYKITEAEFPQTIVSENRDNYSLYLLSLPLSISYYFLDKNLSASVGAIPGILIYSTGGSGPSADFSKTAVGVQVQLRYQFIPKLWLMAGFQEYSTKLYAPELKQSFSNLRLMKLGLKYDI
ncbi:MAG: outer membrane beta-barrel protein [Paludibacteraceae bacterium]